MLQAWLLEDCQTQVSRMLPGIVSRFLEVRTGSITRCFPHSTPQVQYCSKQCQEIAWRQYHKEECEQVLHDIYHIQGGCFDWSALRITTGCLFLSGAPLKVLSVRLHEKCQIKLPVSPLGSASGTPLSKHLSAKANSSKYQNQCQWLQSLRSFFRGTLVLSRAHIKMPALPWWPVPLQ